MRAALVTGAQTIELREMPEPEPSPGRAVVRIGYCGICGTDVEPWLTGTPYNPAICGHEWMGHVTAVPAGVQHVKEGDRVAIGIAPPCGACDACRAGQRAWCRPAFLGLLGIGPLAAAHGGFAPAIAIDAARLYRVRDGIDDASAALLEPATVALHAVQRTDLPADASVVVLGAGPIGLLILQCLLARGAGRVTVVEPHALRRERARVLGASAVIDPASEDLRTRVQQECGPLGPDAVFECAGVPATIQQAVQLVRRGGKVALVGLAAGTAEIQPAAWLVQEVTLVASLGYLAEEFDETQDLMLDGRLRAAELVTSTTPLSQIGAAFERLHESRDEIKILVDPHA